MPKVPKISEKTLESIGLKKKDMDVYVSLLKLGTAPLRRISDECGLNRGTTYDTLKRLMSLGIVSYVNAKTHRYFTAEDPRKLTGVATRREIAAVDARKKLEEIIPDLQNLLGWSKHRPSVRYYEGEAGVRDILQDVLGVCGKSTQQMFRVYSSAGIRDLISNAWPGFVKKRIKENISVKALAIGEGGRTAGLDERKWISKEHKAPTYIFIYPGKTAYVSVDEKLQLFGVIIDDAAIASTQEMIFDVLWGHLH